MSYVCERGIKKLTKLVFFRISKMHSPEIRIRIRPDLKLFFLYVFSNQNDYLLYFLISGPMKSARIINTDWRQNVQRWKNIFYWKSEQLQLALPFHEILLVEIVNLLPFRLWQRFETFTAQKQNSHLKYAGYRYNSKISWRLFWFSIGISLGSFGLF